MPPQLREIGFHVENHATQWHGFQHEIQLQEVVVAWIQLTPLLNTFSYCILILYAYKDFPSHFITVYIPWVAFWLVVLGCCAITHLVLFN